MLTLAVAPAVTNPGPGLTPLEAAVERLRHAALRRILDGGGSQAPIFEAVQGLRDFGLSRKDVFRCCRLAFRMARRDALVLGLTRPPGDDEPYRLEPDQIALLAKRVKTIEEA